eukprot:6633543-Prymnesium_polylepis.1
MRRTPTLVQSHTQQSPILRVQERQLNGLASAVPYSRATAPLRAPRRPREARHEDWSPTAAPRKQSPQGRGWTRLQRRQLTLGTPPTPTSVRRDL